jgi:hypothetical protein
MSILNTGIDVATSAIGNSIDSGSFKLGRIANRTNAILQIDGFLPRNIQKFEYEFSQSVDKLNNQPVASPTGGKLKITVEARENTDFLYWMANKSMKKNGMITVFTFHDTSQAFREIEFHEARIVNYKETWVDPAKGKADDSAHIEYIEIVWSSLRVGGVMYDNNWEAESDIFGMGF